MASCSSRPATVHSEEEERRRAFELQLQLMPTPSRRSSKPGLDHRTAAASASITLGDVALHDATAGFLCLRQLPPRTWWRMRELSVSWQYLLDGSQAATGARSAARKQSGGRDNMGLIRALLEQSGPLRTANEEVSFAGLIYTAVHHGSSAPLQLLMRPLSLAGWARSSFATAVSREALVQAAEAGDAATCRIVLSAARCAPDPANDFADAVNRRRCPRVRVGMASITGDEMWSLGKADAERALEKMEEWESMVPGALPESRLAEVRAVLRAVR